jgi:hypothetical protein
MLDKLMNLVGVLVLSRNQILQYTVRHDDAALGASSQHLNLITTELQEGVMKTRMQPIGTVARSAAACSRSRISSFYKPKIASSDWWSTAFSTRRKLW